MLLCQPNSKTVTCLMYQGVQMKIMSEKYCNRLQCDLKYILTAGIAFYKCFSRTEYKIVSPSDCKEVHKKFYADIGVFIND